MIAYRVDVASQIKAAREASNLSQSRAAKAWGINLRTLQQWEQGNRFPSGKMLLKLMPYLTAPKHSPSTHSRSG